MKTSRAWVGAGIAAVVVTAGCGQGTVTLPTPPMQAETAQLVATYQMPTGMLDTTNIQQAASDAKARVGQLQLNWLPNVISDALTGLGKRLDQTGLPTSPSTMPDPKRAQLTAVAEVNRLCEGFSGSADAGLPFDAGATLDAGATPDAGANGSIDLTGIVDTGKLNPEIWGTASACRTQVAPVSSSQLQGVASTLGVNTTLDVAIDGTLILYLLGPFPTSLDDLQVLVTFTGTLGVEGQVATGSLDFEIQNDAVSFRIQEGGGDVIVTVGATLGIQGANGGFSCSLTSDDCTRVN
ncbi:MAG TPA: hypothetical protein VHG72_00295 [Polyangia bacterium]|nr:hypothetical protein [Polyangia bacterium]